MMCRGRENVEFKEMSENINVLFRVGFFFYSFWLAFFFLEGKDISYCKSQNESFESDVTALKVMAQTALVTLPSLILWNQESRMIVEYENKEKMQVEDKEKERMDAFKRHENKEKQALMDSDSASDNSDHEDVKYIAV